MWPELQIFCLHAGVWTRTQTSEDTSRMITIYGYIVKWFWLVSPPPQFYFLPPKKKKKKKRRSQRWSITRELQCCLICLVSNGNLLKCVRGIQGSGGIAMTSDFGRLSCSAATVIIVQASRSGSAALTFKTKCFWSLCNPYDLLLSYCSLRGQRATPVWNQ